MSFTSLLIHSVSIITNTESGAPDRYGDPTLTETTVTSTARVQPRSGTELLNDRDTRLSEFLLFLPTTTAITATSEVVYDGNRYRVVGRPRVVDDSDGPHHKECDLELLEG